jgi:hypothetical protein
MSSYIYRLDCDYILSLAQTVSWQEVDALRDAIWQHIACETSIRVHIPVCFSNAAIGMTVSLT